MKRLKVAGLYGQGLISIRTPEMRDRYNECLEAAGIDKTALHTFHIDAMGWSPEIADEKNDRHYLSQGEANQLAIILTPDQRHRPLYNPMYSFQWPLIDAFMGRNLEAIANITADTGIWIDMDLGVSCFRDALDLLLIDDIAVHASSISPLMQASSEQRELVSRFMSRGDAWFDPELRGRIVESVKTHGDLRGRQAAIEEMTFSDTRSFHTQAFGGVFVLRNLRRHKAILVCREEIPLDLGEHEGIEIVNLYDPELLPLLEEEGLIRIDLEGHAGDPSPLARMTECILVDTICAHDPKIDYGRLTSAQRKAMIRKLSKSLPEEFYELERLMKNLKRSGETETRELPQPMHALLYQPAAPAASTLNDVLWTLLCSRNRLDILRLYRHNKPLFFHLYHAWPEAKKHWAVGLLKEHVPADAKHGANP